MSPPRRAFVVIDLGFGDAGKGLVTDFLVRRERASLVVRFNGGAQAGHNVVTAEGQHHTFAQFGAGTFVPGVRTFLAHPFVLHPTALLVEHEALRAQGVRDALERLRVSERARVITPFHQALNRLRELARGDARHGSCGVGVGETVRDALAWPEDTVRAGDLRDPARLRPRLQRVRERLYAELRPLEEALPDSPGAERERALFTAGDDAEGILEAWLARAARLVDAGVVAPDETLDRALATSATTVFEGAQGVLLDEAHGFHPHTTWSDCTARPALDLLARAGGKSDTGLDIEVLRVGVLRSHMVRHGAGPLPTETPDLGPLVSEHNALNDWQGGVRYGWFDAVLARYALDVLGGVDRLALTHLDLLSRLRTWKAASGYQAEPLSRLPMNSAPSLERQAWLARWLLGVTPVLEEREPHESAVLAHIEQLLGRRVDLVSRGPRARDVSARPA